MIMVGIIAMTQQPTAMGQPQRVTPAQAVMRFQLAHQLHRDPAPMTPAGKSQSRKVKRSSTWDLPSVPDLTRVTRSCTPTAKHREMEDREARAKESVGGSRPKPKPRKKANTWDIGNPVRSSRTMEGRMSDRKKGMAGEQKRSH
jgi:hypothetical protein